MKLAYTSLAKYYDLIFSRKDYPQEVEFIRTIIKDKCPEAKNILDIGCGTGEHLNLLKDEFETLWGVDVNQEIINEAKKKSDKINYLVGGMKDFAIDAKFDVITCLYSVFNYNLTLEDATMALDNFKKHLNPGGVIIFALYTPHNTDKVVSLHMGNNDEIEVAKINQYVFDPATGLETTDFLIFTKTSAGVDFQVEKNHKYRIYSTEEFSSLCQKSGFTKHEYFDRFQNIPVNGKTKYPVAVIQE
jgi:ubiquinone/menaquinone biosynthesis C-methylase UbiE